MENQAEQDLESISPSCHHLLLSPGVTVEDVLPSVTGVPPLLGRAWGVLISVGPQQLFEGEGTSFLGPPLLFQSLYPKFPLYNVQVGCAGGMPRPALVSAFPPHRPGPPMDPRLPFSEAVSLLELCCPFQLLSHSQACARVPIGPSWHHI